MAKGYNPADAHRKAEKAKQKKRNKEDRKKASETKDVKKSTAGLESEIRDLSAKERKSTLTSAEKADLDTARAEVARVKAAKADYVAKNPEQRQAVYGVEKPAANDLGPGLSAAGIHIPAAQLKAAQAEGLRFDKKGRLLNPEKSLYYDKIFNPYGVPPPGMPYKAHPPTAEEIAAMQKDEDDAIPLPPGPPPGAIGNAESDKSSDEDSDDSDDIPLPDGPPPTTTTQPIQAPAGSMIRMGDGAPLPPSTKAHIARTPLPPQPTVAQSASLPPRPMPPPIFNGFPGRPGISVAVAAQAAPIVAPPSATPATPMTVDQIAKARAAATISAAPQVRDLQKEATAFVPQALKRKRPVASSSTANSAKIARVSETAVPARPLVVPPGMHLPPGFGVGTAVGPSVSVEDADEQEEVMAGPSRLSTYAQGYLPGYDDDDDDNNDEDEGMQGPARPDADTAGYLPGFDDGDEEMQDVQGPAMPDGDYAGMLPGYDDDDEAAPMAMPARPPDEYHSTLPGYDDDDADEANDMIDLNNRQTYVEDDNDGN